MRRRDDWRHRLDRVVSAGRVAPFQYGEHDCLCFPASAIEAVTGEDLFAPFRGRYSDEEGAKALVPEIEPFLEWLASAHGWAAGPPGWARTGDLAALRLGQSFMCAVVYGTLLLPDKPKGFRPVNLFLAEKVWRIG